MCMVIFAPILAICAFATCGGYHGQLQVDVECADRRQSNLSITINFGYPFRLDHVHFKAALCEGVRNEILFLDGDFSSAAQFFVTVGVFAFLYSLLATVVYVFYQNKYLRNNRGPFVDFLVTVVFSFLWLVSSCCWANALTKIKKATNPTQVLLIISACRAPENKCRATQEPLWSYLNTSAVFGFINVVLWIGDIWFVFKETRWYKMGQRYPIRTASRKRSNGMRERLYNESSFDQPEESFSQTKLTRQDTTSRSQGDSEPQVQRPVSTNQSQVLFSLPQTYLGKPVTYDRENQMAAQRTMIFVNEM